MRPRLSISLIPGVCLALLWGCTQNRGSNQPIDDYSVLSGTLSSSTTSEVSGTGIIGFNNPLYGIMSHHHLTLQIIFNTDGNSVTVHSNVSSPQLLDGVRIVLTKNGNDLTVQISTPGDIYYDVSSYFKGLAATSPVDLSFDILNGEKGGVRILAWQGTPPLFSEKTAFFDTARAGLYFRSNGQGSGWALELTGVTILVAQKTRAYVR